MSIEKEDRRPPRQRALFALSSPLRERIGIEFFKSAPRLPGVYLFKDQRNDILYIGKAKNLRNRLNSYKNARAETVSRKTWRMLRLVRKIELVNCADETEALLTENRLLREHRPLFNVVNTHPETYYFIDVDAKEVDQATELKLELSMESVPRANVRRYGVFKGKGMTRRAFQSLLRLLCALQARSGEPFSYPQPLMRYRVPASYRILVAADLVSELHAFLGGRSRAFLRRVTLALLENDGIPRFIYHVITEDLKTLDKFYFRGPRRLLRLKREHGIRRRAVAQAEIDDLLVLSARSSPSER